MSERVRVLVVEDDVGTRRAVVRALQAADPSLMIEECGDGLRVQALLEKPFDCVFLDYQLPGKDGLSILREARAAKRTPAFIMLTACGDESLAVEAMHAGAADYLAKALMIPERLLQRLRHALRIREAERQTEEVLQRLRTNEERLNRTMEAIADGVLIADASGRYVFANPAAERILNLPAAQMLGHLYWQPPWTRLQLDGSPLDMNAHPLERVLHSGEPATNIEFAVIRADGRRIIASVSAAPLLDASGKLDGLVTTFRDITESKQAEEALRQSERFVRHLVNTSPSLLYIYDLVERRNLYSNREMVSILGYSPQQVLEMGGDFLALLAHPDDLPLVEEHYRRLMGAGDEEVIEVEFRMRHASGDWRWLRGRDSVFHRGSDGSARQVIGTALDITDSKRAEQALRESEARYRSLFENSPVALWEEDFSQLKAHLDGLRARGVSDIKAHLRAHPDELMHCVGLVRVLDVNRATMRLYEADRREHLIENLQVVAGEWACNVYLGSMVAVARGQRHFEVESRQRTLKGQIKHVSIAWSVAPGFEDSYEKVFLSVVDITQRKTAEEALRDTNERLGAIIEASPLGICVIDMNWNVRLWSPAMHRIFGWNEQEVLGRPLPLVPEDRQDEFVRLRNDVARGRMFTGIELRRHRRDGSIVEVNLSTATIRDAAGRIAGIIGLFEDITDTKRLREQLLQAHRMETVGRLAGGVAHDFNNLLAVIGGYSEALSRHMKADDPLLGHVQEIQRAADRGAAVTRQLLTFSRRQAVQTHILDLNDLVRGIHGMLRHMISEKITIDVRHADDAVPVRADPSRMEQVLVNLALNARDAMPGGGTLTIAISQVDFATARADTMALPAGRYAVIEVRDTGCGIAEKTRPQIFEPFFTTKEGTGTGLGLSIVYEIVRQSGGTVTVDSEPGKGATFRVFLPLADSAA